MIHIEHFTFNAFETRCCVVWDDNGKCAIVDPGCASPQEILTLVSFISARCLEPVCIMLTHAHFDHIYGMSALTRQYGIPVYAHKKEMFTLEKTNPYACQAFGLPLPDTFPISAEGSSEEGRYIPVKEGDVVKIGSLSFEVIETPGHTVGGVCYLERTGKILFCGDTVMDAGAAKNAGCDFAAVLNGTTPAEGFEGWPCVHIAPDLYDLARWLGIG